MRAITRKWDFSTPSMDLRPATLEQIGERQLFSQELVRSLRPRTDSLESDGGSIEELLLEFRLMGPEYPVAEVSSVDSVESTHLPDISNSASQLKFSGSTYSLSPSNPLPLTSHSLPKTWVSTNSSTSASTKECNFCKNNGELPAIYTTHNLKEGQKIICPILRKHVCPYCLATGDNAHTNKYCPKAKDLNIDLPIPMSAVRRQYRNAIGRKMTKRY